MPWTVFALQRIIIKRDTMKDYYENKIKEITKKLFKNNGDLKFEVVADSHLDNSLCDILKN